MARKNLVIVRAGDRSLHPHWLQGDGERSWDIIVSYFGDDPDRYREADVVRIDGKGPKWPALFDVIGANMDAVRAYDYVWLPDDDLLATKADVNKVFALCRERRLEVAQPSLTWDSYYSHLVTLRNPRTLVRYTNYVEVMAPCLSQGLLQKAWRHFGDSDSGWGLDHAWWKLVDDPSTQVAILDEVSVVHTRPVGGPNYALLRAKGVSPWDEMRATLARFGLPEQPEIATHMAVWKSGRPSRRDRRSVRFGLSVLAGWIPAVAKVKEPRRLARRLAGAAWKFLAGRPDRVVQRTDIA